MADFELCSHVISHTVLSELYLERLVTEDEWERMKSKGGYLADQLVPIQFTKTPEVVDKSADLIDKFGYNEEGTQLRGWWAVRRFSSSHAANVNGNTNVCE